MPPMFQAIPLTESEASRIKITITDGLEWRPSMTEIRTYLNDPQSMTKPDREAVKSYLNVHPIIQKAHDESQNRRAQQDEFIRMLIA